MQKQKRNRQQKNKIKSQKKNVFFLKLLYAILLLLVFYWIRVPLVEREKNVRLIGVPKVNKTISEKLY